MSRLKVFEAFAGIGSQVKALQRLGIDYEGVGVSEIDKNAIFAYHAIHKHTLPDIDISDMSDEDVEKELERLNIPLDKKTFKRVKLKKEEARRFLKCVKETHNFGDISKIDVHTLPDIDLFTFSFPCQDLSQAGKQRGLKKGDNTRSGLLWECEKIIREKRPKLLLMENVKTLVGKKFIEDFEEWLKVLEELGYNTYYQVLNSKYFDNAQSRERVFAVSILKDIDKGFVFPKNNKITKVLKDILEDEVDESYLIKEKYLQKLDFTKLLQKLESLEEEKRNLQKNTLFDVNVDDIIYKQQRLFGIYDSLTTKHQLGSVYHKDRLSPTLDTMSEIGILNVALGASFLIEIDGNKWCGHTRTENKVFMENQVGLTLTTNAHYNVLDNRNLKVRKLTPKECYRLMGFDDNDYEEASKVCSNSALYKQAGNSIVVNVLEAIFNNMKEYF